LAPLTSKVFIYFFHTFFLTLASSQQAEPTPCGQKVTASFSRPVTSWSQQWSVVVVVVIKNFWCRSQCNPQETTDIDVLCLLCGISGN